MSGAGTSMNAIRPAGFAGSWYEGDPTALGRAVDRLVAGATGLPYAVRGAVLPHAGHAFSGRGIAPLFRNLPPAIRSVVILAPSHYARLPEDRIGYGAFAALDTPLGPVPGLAAPFAGRAPFAAMDRAVAAEHSAEMFLPFIRRTLPDAAAAILLIPRLTDAERLFSFADAIAGATAGLGEDTIFLASSDFTHYGDRFGYAPFGTRDIDAVLAKVAAQDRRYAELIAHHRYAEVFEARRRDEPTICGLDPALVLSRLMDLRGLRGEVAGYYTSCDIAGKSADFVCYATILFH